MMTSLLQRLQPTERLIPGLLFILVSSVYFATVTGITSSNDGSHYAAARAFATSGRLDIAPYAAFTQEQDYAIGQDGSLRTDRPPGTGIIASVVYRLGRLAPEPFIQVPSRHDPHNPRVIYAALTSVLAGAGALVLFYAILRQHFEVGAAPALLAALALGFGTATWKYSTVLYSHALTSLTLFAILYIIFRAERRGAFSWREAAITGFCLGASVLIEYTNAVMIMGVLSYLAVIWGADFLRALRDSAARRPWLGVLIAGTVGGLLPLAFFVGYNTLAFGGPFKLSTFQVDTELWPQNRGLAADFATPLWYGLQGMLLWGGDNQGLFLLSPVSLLSLPGLPILYREARRRFWLVIGLFVVFLLLFSKSTTFNTGTNDGRYLVPFLGLWFVPFALWLDQRYFRVQGEVPRALAGLLLFGLLFLSVRNMAAHIALSWGYELDLANLEYRSIPPHNLALVGSTLFPNARNLPLLWLLEAIALGASLVFLLARRTLASHLRPIFDALALLALLGFTLAPVANALRDPQPLGMTALDAPIDDDLYLLGYQLSAWNPDPLPGDPVRARLYWRLERPVSQNVDLRLALVDGDGKTWGQMETPLGLATFRQIPVTTWPAGHIVQEEYVIPLDAPPPYSLETDLLLTAGDETVSLFRLRPATLTLGGPPTYRVAYDFEGLARLTGYDVQTLAYHRLAVTLHWQVTVSSDEVYTAFIHIVSADGTIAAQRDAQPFEGRFPTSEWQPGDTLADRHEVDLGRAFKPGTYLLRVGLYNPDDGTRLPVTNSEGDIVFDSAPVLGEIALP